MDYQTKPIKRKTVRSLAKVLRMLFDVPLTGALPVMEMLDRLPDIFPECNYMVVEDGQLSSKTMAQCTPNDNGGFTILIKESVYNGAANDVGAFLGFICHEICHIFLFHIGYTPIFTRTFENNELPNYCSVEWQAKALCGEVMIPFDESKGLNWHEIVEQYHVSDAIAQYRCKLEQGR